MKVQRKIDPAARVVILEVDGELSDGDLLSLSGEVGGAPDVGPDFSLLIDLRSANGKLVTSAGVRELASLPLVLSTASRRAVVVPSDLGFGMARMYEMLRDGRGGGTRVFRDYDEALRWVKGSPSPGRPV